MESRAKYTAALRRALARPYSSGLPVRWMNTHNNAITLAGHSSPGQVYPHDSGRFGNRPEIGLCPSLAARLSIKVPYYLIARS